MKKFLLWLKEPHGIGLIAVYLIAAVTIGGTVAIVVRSPEGVLFETAAYLLYLVAALVFGYTVYSIVYLTRKGIRSLTKRSKFLTRLKLDFEFRTILFATGSFITTAAYAAFDGALSFLSASVWYGALAVFYLLLAVLRGGVLIRRRRGVRRGATPVEIGKDDARAYFSSGILLIAFTLALSGMLVQMIRENRSIVHIGTTILVSAIYAFVKIIFAVVNLFKAKRNGNFTVQAIRNINLADALVSVLSLQIAMLQYYSEGREQLNADVFNAVTGAAVCVLIICMGVLMIVKGRRRLKTLRAEGVPAEAEQEREEGNAELAAEDREM